MTKKNKNRRHWNKTIPKRKDAGRPIDEKPDLEIELQDNRPESVQQAFDILAEAEKEGVETIVKTYQNPDNTHSLGIKPHPHGHEIARSLLNIAGYKSHVGPMAPPLELDDRPLIDLLHEATFTNPPGLLSIKDPYALRMLLRKAHCFTLNDATSSMVADFSMATAQDLEASRQMAIPPFPVTWIELNNHARLNRMKALNAPLEERTIPAIHLQSGSAG